MYAIVRSYSGEGASELFDQLEQKNDEIKELIGGVPGFVSYTAFRSDDGGSTVTVCQDKTGTDESSRRAAEWVNENISATASDHGGRHGCPLQQLDSRGHRGRLGERPLA